LALRYASLGATVICWDVNQESNEETVNEIKKTGTAAAYAYQYVYIVYSFTKCNKTERNIYNSETFDRKAFENSKMFAFHRCDVSNREEVFSVAERVKQEVGNVTILVNNAGIMPCHTFLDYTIDEIKRIFDINVLAHFWVS